MTAPPPPEPSATPDAMTAAASELERLQQLLRRAAQGEAEPDEVQRSLSDYWREHGQSLATAAAAVGEEARGQMLAQLYAWRTQLGQQLASANVSTPPSPEPTAPAASDPAASDPAASDPATGDRDNH